MKITHPSMPNISQSNESSVAPKVHVVAPPEDELFEQQMAAMEPEVKKSEEAKLPQPIEDPVLKNEVAKKLAFEKLMFLSKDQFKEVEYGGLTFKFKVLKSSDNGKILTILQQNSIDDAYKASIMGLAASRVSVNNIPFEEFYTGTDKIENPLLRKYSELSKWPAFMITALMAFSSAVQKESERDFKHDFLKG